MKSYYYPYYLLLCQITAHDVIVFSSLDKTVDLCPLPSPQDPSSRAWVTTMLKEQKRQLQESTDWESTEHMFLVCVFNVAPDQPYTIFKVPELVSVFLGMGIGFI